ncbi:FAD:protein FMN transferase [uncultured Roseovarius sp.]|uniref:FAD:protein FMN transferase n=1 Tax=uncultured Roseovarius sp. TaxID=293344 RepID=UPI000C603EFE|nr:thiamine biosynthesis protein ApbE [Roseovarius sp.]MBD13150.1 thiamine biosynthesis protein ApbE [Roseovarius sp.]|tara:strand:- start:282 stop:1196 length:915 start_codon:yes stop_codon:yes gene_type:complete
MTLSRRRFLSISAATLAFAHRAQATPLYRWQGSALGARATITLCHPEAERISESARAEIERLEQIFSLYRATSALSQLNAAGHLAAPPFELLDCLSLAAAAHRATAGLFDPSVQPIWDLYARSYSAGNAPAETDIATARAHGTWADLRYDTDVIRLRAGMALTLNGIAQGYIADRIAHLLQAEGLNDILIDTGELCVLGGNPQGGDWSVTLDAPDRPQIGLRDRALASSAPFGTVFDTEGTAGHILDPRTGTPATARWQLISVTAKSAAIADALSTAMCLMSAEEMKTAESSLSGVKVVHSAPA